MTSERRGQERIPGPFDATWSGTSGHRTVRVPDFSLTGCFIEDLATPAVGERVIVTLELPPEEPVVAPGTVVYLYAGHGFGVAFDEDDEVTKALHAAIDRITSERPPARR